MIELISRDAAGGEVGDNRTASSDVADGADMDDSADSKVGVVVEEDGAVGVDRDDRSDSRVGLMKLAWMIELIAGV
jgi:hypothetical protein